MTYRNLRFVRLPSDGGMLPVRSFHITFLQDNYTTKLKSLKHNQTPNEGDVEQAVGKIDICLSSNVKKELYYAKQQKQDIAFWINSHHNLCEGGLMWVWEISEGDTKFIYTMKLVPPKDPGSIVHPGTIDWIYHS